MKRAILLLLIMSKVSYAESTPIYLPDIDVVEKKEVGNYISQDDMKRDDAKDLNSALQFTPGITFTGGGGRDDARFSIRGYGVDSVPIYVDGIVMSNPFRGEGDASRLLTGDLEGLTVQKGFSSMLLGANNLGGAIIMTIAKPKKKLELLLDGKFDFDNIFNYAGNTYVASVGTKQSKFYTKATFQYRNIDHFRLPEKFKPTIGNPQQKGDRLWSDSIDKKFTTIIGTTPIDGLDIWLTYIDQTSDKGLSPPDTSTTNYQIWDWPFWNRESISLNGEYKFSYFKIDLLTYYDKYDNRLIEYYNMKAFLAGISAPPSDYDEYTYGARLKGEYQINSWNRLSVGVTFKNENHIGLKDSKREIEVNETLLSLGAEYSISPLKYLTFVAGAGYDMLLPQRYWSRADDTAKELGLASFLVKTDDMYLYTWQLGAFYEFISNHELRLTYARKNHFPNMAQRYSTRFGDMLPNPNLGPETANHIELGYKGNFYDTFYIDTAVYYSKIYDKIVTIQIPNPDNPVAPVDYARNLDSTSFYGLELEAKLYLFDMIALGSAFSLNEYNIDFNQSKEILAIPYYPQITANAYLDISPIEQLSIVTRFQYISSRFATSAGDYRLNDYFLLNIKVIGRVNDYLELSFGIHNLLDELYEIRQYTPLSGRQYSFTLTVKY